MEPINIIALAENNWNGPWMNRQQLLSRLGKKFNILYTNGVFSTWDVGNKAWCAAPVFSQYKLQDSVILHRPGKALLRNGRFEKYDNFVLNLEIRNWKRRVGFDYSHSITYAFGPNYKKYVEIIGARFLVYHVYDFFEKYPFWTKEKDFEHRWMLNNADLVVASSELLVEHLKKISKRSVKLLENGVDFNAFSLKNYKIPEDLRNIPSPKIMYVGNINRKVDLALVNNICKFNSHWQWIFVGGNGNLGDDDKVILKKLKARNNVHFLGGKDYTELPFYANNSDINVMVYKEDKNLWASAGYPLKLNEYLATGKPVISVGLQSVKKYSDIIEIASGVDEWGQSIRKQLDARGDCFVKTRQREAKKNDWNNKVLLLEQWLKELIPDF